MLIEKTLGNWSKISTLNLKIDRLELEWFETTKRILRKISTNGQDIAIRRPNNALPFADGDILFQSETDILIIDILPCEIIVLEPQTMSEMGALCYEIGNRHAPIFVQSNQILLPFDEPMFRLLNSNGFRPQRDFGKLTNRLTPTITQNHAHINTENVAQNTANTEGSSLFTKIMNWVEK